MPRVLFSFVFMAVFIHSFFNQGGKSAILTGLTVCLGGKATFTNRGSSIKTLLKEGTSFVSHLPHYPFSEYCIFIRRLIPLSIHPPTQYNMQKKSVGSVTVRLRNQGPDAYRPGVYGKSISIERKIVKDGSGSYKITGAAGGRVISTRKEELNAILDHMNIAIDNPLSVLTQDTSRMFLANSTNKEKYNVCKIVLCICVKISKKVL